MLIFTVALMVSLKAWQTAAPLLHPLAVANVAAAVVTVALAVIRPAPLVLCILLVVTFSGPWVFAVLRKASQDADSGG